MKKGALLLVGLGCLLGTSACGWLPGGTDWDPFASPGERRLAIRIENANRNDVEVRVISGGRRHNLGTVSSRTFRQTSIPWSSTQDLRFEINPLTGRRHTTQGVMVSPGDRVELIVADPVQRSVIRR
jgi:hypothetical protein